jgi:cell division protein FtsZ
MHESFALVDDVLRQCVQGISELLYEAGFVNVDFKDLQKVLKNSGRAYFGIGHGKGENRALDAAQNAVNSKMIDKSVIESAQSILINTRGSMKFSMEEAMKSVNYITSIAKNNGSEPEVIWGGGNYRNIKDDEVYITVIATGIPKDKDFISGNSSSNRKNTSSDFKEKVEINSNKYKDDGLDIPDFLKSQMG